MVGRAASAVVRVAALAHNLERIRAAAPQCRVLAVVKANAYGHGMEGVAPALRGADAFAVACIDEAIRLRDAGIEAPVVLLEGVFDAAELVLAARYRCELVVHSAWQVDALAASRNPAYRFPVWLKIDTGMNRLGFPLREARAAWEGLCGLDAVGVVRLMTHLACADEPESEATAAQLERFTLATEGWPGERSIANSAGVFAWPDSHGDWVRPGLALYGVSPFADRDAAALGLQPVMTLQGRLIAVREVRAGESVGYGGAWTATGDCRVGIVGIGYGDGYPRHAAPDTPVLVNGVRCPLVGRVSMDMLSVVLDAVDAAVGDTAVLWGDGLPVEEVARAAGTIPWTLLCGVTDRVRHEYVD